MVKLRKKLRTAQRAYLITISVYVITHRLCNPTLTY